MHPTCNKHGTQGVNDIDLSAQVSNIDESWNDDVYMIEDFSTIWNGRPKLILEESQFCADSSSVAFLFLSPSQRLFLKERHKVFPASRKIWPIGSIGIWQVSHVIIAHKRTARVSGVPFQLFRIHEAFQHHEFHNGNIQICQAHPIRFSNKPPRTLNFGERLWH